MREGTVEVAQTSSSSSRAMMRGGGGGGEEESWPKENFHTDCVRQTVNNTTENTLQQSLLVASRTWATGVCREGPADFTTAIMTLTLDSCTAITSAQETNTISRER